MTKTEGNPMTPEELEEHEKALSAYDNLELEDEEKTIYIEETCQISKSRKTRS